MRKIIANLILLLGSLLATVRLLYSKPDSWISKIFPDTPMDAMLKVAVQQIPVNASFLSMWNIHLLTILYQFLGIAVITGVIFYILRKG